MDIRQLYFIVGKMTTSIDERARNLAKQGITVANRKRIKDATFAHLEGKALVCKTEQTFRMPELSTSCF